MMAGGKVEDSQPRKNIDVIQLTIEAKYNLHSLRTRRSCSFEQEFYLPGRMPNPASYSPYKANRMRHTV